MKLFFMFSIVIISDIMLNDNINNSQQKTIYDTNN